MDDIKEKIEKRIEFLKTSLQNVQNNANAHMGAIAEFEKMLKELDSSLIDEKIKADN